MRRITLILTLVIIWACETKSKTDHKEEAVNDFQTLISKLQKLEIGYTYDLLKQDTEGCYIPDKHPDSLFYNPPLPILGQFNNGTVYSIVHFEPGDDMWPIIQTFDKEGNVIDKVAIAFGHCAAPDCELVECEERFKIIDQNTIEDVMTLVATPCDSLGKRDQEQITREVWKRTITIDEKGKLISKEKKS